MRQCVYDGDGCQHRLKDSWECGATDSKMLECAIARIEEDNEVCICGHPISIHENYGEEGEACEHGCECVRVSSAAQQIANGYRQQIADLDADKPFTKAGE